MRAAFLLVCGLLAPPRMQSADLYVSTNGTPTAAGTIEQPYDLRTALSGVVGHPGDTFWLRGGNYELGHMDTQIEGAPGQPITFRQMPGEWARIDGSLTFYLSGGNLVLRDFELFSSDTNRVSTQTGVGFNVTDIRIIPGIASFVPDLTFINLIVHDHTRHGFYLSNTASSNVVYGCVIYNNGWVSPDNAEGHGVYAQGENGPKEISDNIVFSSSGANMHIYDDGSGRRLSGVTLDGNVAFNAGAIQNVRVYRDWIVGVDAPAVSADRIVLKNNMGYYPPDSNARDQVQIGRQGINGSIALLNNYLPHGLLMNNWTIAAVSGNFFMAQKANYILSLDQTQVPLAAAWDNNTYLRSATGKDVLNNSREYSFSDWQGTTGFDEHSTYSVGAQAGTKVFVRTNRYQPGRAHIIIYNWDSLTNVIVDLGSVLSPGTPYELRNASDLFAAPVSIGIFDGQPLNLPMSALTVAAPNGPLLTPAPTGPVFNVFVLMPYFLRLQITATDGQAQISWPASFSNVVLQSKEIFSTNSLWTDDTNTPAVVGDRYVVRDTLGQSTRFYRLRTAQ